MPLNKFFVSLGFLLACVSCIVPFDPDIDEFQELMVISGVITDKPGLHSVTISRAVPYNEPRFIPVSGYLVTIEDQDGNLWTYQEQSPGIYEVDLKNSFLGVGKSYSITVRSPFGTEYRSDYDTLHPCPPLGNIYFEEGITDLGVERPGIQFYNSVNGIEGGVGNFRWILSETWEFDTPYQAQLITYDGVNFTDYDGHFHTKCYHTRQIPSIYTATTANLSENQLHRNPLNFVSDQQQKLLHQYSLLVEQHSLSHQAWLYWNQLKSSISESGGLYENQPISAFGNLYNVNDPDEQVMGLFYATQVQSKRIIVRRNFNFPIPASSCLLDTINYLEDFHGDYPALLMPFGLNPHYFPFLSGETHCFDCRGPGNELEKPSYW